MGGVLGFLAGGVRLHRMDLQCPVLAAKIDDPVQAGLHARAGHYAALDLSAAVVEPQRNVEPVERSAADAHVSLDVDGPAAAAAQRLLQIDAENGAIRRLERGCAGQACDRGGGRSAGGLKGEADPRRSPS